MQETIKVRNNKKQTNSLKAVIPLLCLLLVGAILFGLLSMKKDGQGIDLVDDSKKQAVYLQGGQIFFGDITDISKGFVTLQDVYYLQVTNSSGESEEGDSEAAQAQQGSAISLTKRGCEIAAPEEKMFISRREVSYFENLKNDSDIVKGIDQWVKDNPNGLDCGN